MSQQRLWILLDAGRLRRMPVNYTYIVDDWLVIRTDENGHDSGISTELWPEWGKVGVNEVSPEYLEKAKARVIRRAKQLNLWPLGCHNGYCSKCESTFDPD